MKTKKYKVYLSKEQRSEIEEITRRESIQPQLSNGPIYC